METQGLSNDRDLRKFIDVKETDARGQKRAGEGDLRSDDVRKSKAAAGKEASDLQTRHDELQEKLDSLERLVIERLGENPATGSNGKKKSKNKGDVFKSSGTFDQYGKSDLYRSGSAKPVSRSKDKDAAYRQSAHGNFKSGLYDPKLERDVNRIYRVRFESQRFKLCLDQRAQPEATGERGTKDHVEP